MGILSIAFAIICIYMKLLKWHYYMHSDFYADEKVYQVANEFVHEASYGDVKTTLTDCFDFDKGNVEKILSLSILYRTDKDGFIGSL